jgi:predicted aspartyl protease
MRKATVRIRVTNLGDLELARRGLGSPALVRSAEIAARIDPGATTLVLPAELGARLGLRVEGRRKVRYADGRTEEVPWVSGVRLEILGRAMSCDALLEAASTVPLLGQSPLETLDLLVDAASGALAVNPASPDLPLLDLLPVSWASAALA